MEITFLKEVTKSPPYLITRYYNPNNSNVKYMVPTGHNDYFGKSILIFLSI